MEHKSPPSSTNSVWTFLMWARCKDQLCNPKSCSASTSKELSTCTRHHQDRPSVKCNHRPQGSWGRRQMGGNTAPSHVPSAQLSLGTHQCCLLWGKTYTYYTLPGAGWKTSVIQHLQKPQTVNNNLLLLLLPSSSVLFKDPLLAVVLLHEPYCTNRVVVLVNCRPQWEAGARDSAMESKERDPKAWLNAFFKMYSHDFRRLSK